jgi:Rrf2 family protein
VKLQLESRTELALRTLLLLAHSTGPSPAKELAPQLGTTPHYLPHVMRPLIETGWVTSTTGPGGGYTLTTDLESVSVLQLIETMEGPTDSGVCVLKGGPCDSASRCALHIPWTEARAALLTQLSETPITKSTQ